MSEHGIVASPPPPLARAPKKKAPPGTTDTHFHIFESTEKYPLSLQRMYDPALSTVAGASARQSKPSQWRTGCQTKVADDLDCLRPRGGGDREGGARARQAMKARGSCVAARAGSGCSVEVRSEPRTERNGAAAAQPPKRSGAE